MTYSQTDQAIDYVADEIENDVAWQDAVDDAVGQFDISEHDLLIAFEREYLCTPEEFQTNHEDDKQWAEAQGMDPRPREVVEEDDDALDVAEIVPLEDLDEID